MCIWILLSVQSKQLSLLCLCQRNWFLVVLKLSDDVRTSHGGVCQQSSCVWHLPCSHRDRNAHSAAGQVIWCSCEYTGYNQILIHEKSRAPVPAQSFHAHIYPVDPASPSPLRLVTWPWLVIPIPVTGYPVLPPWWGGETGPGCPATLESPQPSLCPNICNINLQVSLNSLTFKVKSKLKPSIPTKRNRN